MDIAPGNNHIRCIRNNITYYDPQLFHWAPSMKSSVRLLIADINSATDPREVYVDAEKILLVKNHPIRRAIITGRVKGIWHARKDVYEIYIDDCSGPHLVAHAYIHEKALQVLGLNIDQVYGVLVEAEVDRFYVARNKTWMMTMSKVRRLPDQSLDGEITGWKMALQNRKALCQPWILKIPQGRIDNKLWMNIPHGRIESNQWVKIPQGRIESVCVRVGDHPCDQRSEWETSTRFNTHNEGKKVDKTDSTTIEPNYCQTAPYNKTHHAYYRDCNLEYVPDVLYALDSVIIHRRRWKNKEGCQGESGANSRGRSYSREVIEVESYVNEETTERQTTYGYTNDLRCTDSLPVATQLRLVLEIIHFLRRNHTVRLKDLYEDSKISLVLDSMVALNAAGTLSRIDWRTKLGFEENGHQKPNDSSSHDPLFRAHVFNLAWHQLQKAGLIKVTRLQKVKTMGLQQMCDKLAHQMEAARKGVTFNVHEFVQAQQEYRGSVRLVNAIVWDILGSDRENWACILLPTRWRYVKSRRVMPIYVE